MLDADGNAPRLSQWEIGAIMRLRCGRPGAARMNFPESALATELAYSEWLSRYNPGVKIDSEGGARQRGQA